MTGASTIATGERMRRLVAFIACITCAVAIRAPAAAQEAIFLRMACVVGTGVYPKPLVMAAPPSASSLF